MKLVRENPVSLFLVLFVMAFVALVMLQILIIVNQRSSHLVEQAQIMGATSVMNAPTVKFAFPDNSESTRAAPVVTPTSSSLSKIRFGVTDRYVDCHVVTQVATLVLENELDVKSEIVLYDTVDDLFSGLAEREIDLTLCYLDPSDRRRISGKNKEKFGNHMRQIGSYYWNIGSSKLQIWAHVQSRANWREQAPCLLSFFENLRFRERKFQKEDAKAWIQNHMDEVQTWVTCAP
ncbi:MAG: hypothetical protein ACPGWR_11565 [Ardenticatenaceae bacterium]